MSGSLRLAPFAIWSAHASISYAIVAVHCHLAVLHEQVYGTTVGRILLFLVTLAAFALAGVVAIVSSRCWRAAQQRSDDNGRRGFAAGYTAGASALVLLYLLWAAVLDGVVDLC